MTTKSSIFLGGERKNTPSTLSVRHRRCRKVVLLSVHFSTGSPSLSFGYHPRLSMVRLRRRRQLLCTAMTMAVEAEQWWSIDRAVGGVGHRLYIDFFSMCLRRWYDYRLSRYAGAEDFLAHPHYPRRRCELLYFAAGLVLTKLCVELPTDSA